MFDLNNLDRIKKSQPYFIYQRVLLPGPIGYMFFQLDYGFWYVLKEVHAKFPSDNGAVQYPELNMFALQKGIGKESQNIPVPITLFGTPGNSGVQLVGADLTAGIMKAAKLQNIVYAFRDTLQFEFSGHVPGTMPYVEVCLIGYYLPVEDNMMWSSDDGDN